MWQWLLLPPGVIIISSDKEQRDKNNMMNDLNKNNGGMMHVGMQGLFFSPLFFSYMISYGRGEYSIAGMPT